jgi:hypothetical protein
VRSYVLCFVTEEKLAILEADTGNPQPMTICVPPMPRSAQPALSRAPDYMMPSSVGYVRRFGFASYLQHNFLV